MNKVLAIIGCGHLGQQLAHFAIADAHYEKVVFFDDFTTESAINGHRVIGKTETIETAFANKLFDELLIGIGYNNLMNRKLFFDKFENKIPFGTIVHSSCWVDPNAVVKSGTVIYPGSCIDANAQIGSNCIVNLNCTIAHDSQIGDHSFLAPRVAIAGFVTVGDRCFLGINSTIIDNIELNSGTRTGGGTVITKNTIEPGLYVGCPAKKIKA